jgi:methyl-accepting chemotaxis protein
MIKFIQRPRTISAKLPKMRDKPIGSLRKKLIAVFVLITTIPLLVTTIITSYVSHQALTEDVYENNRMVATALAREIDQMLDAKIKLLTILSRDPAILSMNTANQLPILRNVANQYSDMTSIIIADSKGVQTVRTEGVLAKINDRAYFKELVDGASFVISDLIVAKGTGKLSIIIGIPLRDYQNTFKGVILGVVDVHYLGNYISQTKVGKTGYAFLVDRNGKIIAHPDTQLVQNMVDVSSIPAVKAAISGQIGYQEYDWEGVKKLAGYSFVPMARWGLIVQQNMDEAMASSNKVKNIGIAVTFLTIIVAGFVGFLAAGRISKPLQDLVVITTQISEGDLTAQATVTTNDEIGQLANSFNTMILNLKNLIRQVMNTAEQVAASAEELSATSNEAERAINQISTTTTGLAQGAQRQTSEVNKAADIIQHLSETSQSVSEKALTAANLSTEMANAAQTGNVAAKNAIDKINEIKRVTAETSNAVISLGEKSGQIGQIVDVITDIAGQTNLLALNAAIEAARAGEAGRGFAVVADEVRKLAEQSQEAAKQIIAIIAEIQTQTAQAIDAMQVGSNRVSEGVEVVETAGMVLNNILAKVQNSVSMIEEIANAASQQVKATHDAVDSMEEIAVIANQSNANAQHTAAATEETTASMEEIAGAAQALAETAGELQLTISRFRV